MPATSGQALCSGGIEEGGRDEEEATSAKARKQLIEELEKLRKLAESASDPPRDQLVGIVAGLKIVGAEARDQLEKCIETLRASRSDGQ